MRLGDLEIGLGECDEIGIGSRSVVRAAVHKPSNDKVAVKIYPGHGSASSDEERAELNHILHLPPHPSVVTVRSVLVENGEHLGALFGRDDSCTFLMLRAAARATSRCCSCAPAAS